MRRRFVSLRDVPLLWKILVPFLVLMLVVGVVGSFAIVRSLSDRAQASIDQELTLRTTDARSTLHNHELSLLEAVGFAANLQGMASAIERRDRAAAADLLRSVRALKPDLDVLVVTDAEGRALSGSITVAGKDVTADIDWPGVSSVAGALAAAGGATTVGFDRLAQSNALLVASTVCTGTPCRPVGTAIVGFDARKVAAAIGDVIGRTNGVALYDSTGRRLAEAGVSSSRSSVPEQPETDRSVRIRESTSGTDVNTAFASFQLKGDRAGFVAVTIPTEPFFASVRSTAWRLAILLLIAMAGIVAIGSVLARMITAELRPLLETNRALGRGDLDARVPVIGSDELGELAAGLNDMADQLQASHETLELRVRQRTEEVQRLLNERTQIFASVSHQFRTPLAVIIGQVNMLRDSAWRRDNARQAIETIDEASIQLLALIEDVLAAARVEVGQLDVAVEEVRVPDVVGGVRRTLEGLVRSGEHDLVVDIPPDLPAVQADPARLQEILLSLVDNSVKYTPPGGVIELSAMARNGHIELSVRDDGPGIPKRMTKQVFEPFVRVRGARTQRGQSSSGIGLAITKRLVEAQGGKIWLESKAGKGTTFTFTLRPS